MGQRMEEAIRRFREIQEKNLLGGGEEQIQRQHSRGKLTARERIDILVDPGTFRELGSCVNTTGTRVDGVVPEAPCDGVVVGTAEVHGRPVMVHASDFTVLGGSVAIQNIFKYCRSLEMAASWGIPMVNLLDSSGGRLGYRDVPMAGLDWQFRLQSLYSGVIPQITVLMGPCIAGGAYLPALCDFLIMSRISGNLWLGGPRQTAAATSEQIDEEIGKADYHMEFTGTCDLVEDDDRESIEKCRDLLRYLPQSCRERPPKVEPSDRADREVAELTHLVPDAYEETYDMHEVIRHLADHGEYLEVKDRYARQLITCLCRMDGEVVGIVASNPLHPGSILEVDACDKYYRFLQVLDAYNIPLVNLVDTPPVVPGETEEARGLLRHIGKVLDVYATSTIPKISVTLREAYADAGSLIMGGVRSMGADLTYAWPIARFAVEASDLDYREVYGKGIEEDAYESYLNRSREKVDVFEAGRSWSAQMVDEIIEPADTRRKIIEALRITRNKVERLPTRAKSHGTGPT
jgi:acetyl-CoA carboxylase carboxyltransferase component